MPIKKDTKTKLPLTVEDTSTILKGSKLSLEECAQQFLTLHGNNATGHTLRQPLALTTLPDGEYTSVEGADVVVEDGNLEVRTNGLNAPESTIDMPYPAPQLSIEDQKALNEALFWKTQERVSKHIKAQHPNTTRKEIAKRREANKAARKARRR